MAKVGSLDPRINDNHTYLPWVVTHSIQVSCFHPVGPNQLGQDIMYPLCKIISLNFNMGRAFARPAQLLLSLWLAELDAMQPGV